MSWNTRSVARKIVEVREILEENEVAIACLEETRTRDIVIPGYSVLHSTTRHKEAVGVAMLVLNGITPVREEEELNLEIELGKLGVEAIVCSFARLGKP